MKGQLPVCSQTHGGTRSTLSNFVVSRFDFVYSFLLALYGAVCYICNRTYTRPRKMKGVARKQISFRLREDLLQVLRERAERENRSLNNLVESLLLEAMRSAFPAGAATIIKDPRPVTSARQ